MLDIWFPLMSALVNRILVASQRYCHQRLGSCSAHPDAWASMGISIQMLEATGAEGAAMASIAGLNGSENNTQSSISKTIAPNPKAKEESLAAFQKWKNQLLKNII